LLTFVSLNLLAQYKSNNIIDKISSLNKYIDNENVKDNLLLFPKYYQKKLGMEYRPAEITMDDNSSRYLYTYNSNGELLTQNYQINQNNNWLTTDYVTVSYNNAGMPDTTTIQKLVPFTNMLGFYSRSILNYKEGTKIISELGQNYNISTASWNNNYLTEWAWKDESKVDTIKNFQWENNAWVLKMRITYAYSGNNISEMVVELWDYDQNVLRYENKYLMSYNTDGDIISRIVQSYVNNNWENNVLDMYSYEAPGLEKVYGRHFWNGSSWVADYRQYHTYLGTKLTSRYDEVLNTTTNAFVPYQKEVFIYQTSDKHVFYANQLWNVDSSRYITNYEDYYTRNQFGKITSHIQKTLINNVLSNNYKIEYEYDQFGNAIKGEAYDWLNNDWAKTVSGSYQINMSYNTSEEDYFYHFGKNVNIIYSGVTNLENEINLNISFNLEQNYPNPFNPNTTINFTIPNNGFVTLKVYDILGKEVTTLVNQELNSGFHTASFNANNLSSGTYFYVLKFNNYTISKKMLLIK